MMQPLSFATGGADHAIHLWNVDHDLQTIRSGPPLAIRHTSQVHSLLPVQDSSHKLVSSGADCNVNVYDLPSERVMTTIKLSNPGFHVHRFGNPSTLLIQVWLLERLRDLVGLKSRPDCTQGTTIRNTRSTHEAHQWNAQVWVCIG
jgi:WD40 repeat protein